MNLDKDADIGNLRVIVGHCIQIKNTGYDMTTFTEIIHSDNVSDKVSYNVLPLETNKCLLNSSCNVLCSGEGNPCNLVAPIPGPQWQPQSAEAVQQRLINKDYTKAYC
jgi:hypothetical protein